MVDEDEAIESLVAARQCLKTGLQKSRDIASALANVEPRLTDKAKRLSNLEAELFLIHPKLKSVAIGDQIDHAVGFAATLVNVFNTVSELQSSLMADSSFTDLSTYLSAIKQFEEALEFLSANSELTIQWLEGIVQFIEDNKIGVDQCLLDVKKSSRILHELKAAEDIARVDGGPLSFALNKLEFEFKRLLTDHDAASASPPRAAALLSASEIQAYNGSKSVVHQKLKSILTRLKANDRLENCISMYVEVRSSSVRLSLQALDMDYLEMSINDLSNFQSIEDHIHKWTIHLELAVKLFYELEYINCNDIFDTIEPDIRIKCFAEIASQSGFLSLLQFGRKLTETKKDPIKLLNLLDIFLVLDNLRTDINKLFGSKPCSEIQAITRDLVKRVVNGASEIFFELPIQVEMQRRSPPPVDGGIPSLISFVTDYCNKLLGNHYKPILTQVLIIHQSWNQETYQEELLPNQIYLIIKELALNLDAWAKSYQDISQSYYFMMNNHCHFSNLKGTKLGDMMGDGWLNAHSQYREYYAAVYLRESWGGLINLVNQKGQLPFAGEIESVRLRANGLLKKRVREFNQAFEQTYKRQSSWVISDKGMRERICLLLVQAIVPAYMKNFEALVEQNQQIGSKSLKYSSQRMESMFCSLFHFQPTLPNCRSSSGRYYTHSHRQNHFISKIKNVVTNQFRLSVTTL